MKKTRKAKKKISQDTVDKKVIGLTLEEAKKYWDDIRIIEIDGKRMGTSDDYLPMRMNVVIKSKKIVEVFNFG